MWEISLNVQTKNEKFLEIIEKKVKSLDKIKVHSALSRNLGVSMLSLATEKPELELINILKSLIAETIIFIEKEALIRKESNLKNVTKTSFGAFIKALVLFDFDADKKEIMCSLDLNKNLDLHAFFNFRLRPLKKKWQELIQLTNQNNGFIGGADVLLEMLVDNLEVSDRKVFVEKVRSKFILLDEEGREIKGDRVSSNIFDEIELVTNLIILAPKTIKILCKYDITKETMNLINYIFAGRVK